MSTAISGKAPYYAYATILDQTTSDGSFVPPLTEDAAYEAAGLTLPVVVETSVFTTEVVLCNVSATPQTVRLAYVADAVQAPDSTAAVSIPLAAGEQKVIPSFVQYLRSQGVAGVGAPGSHVRGGPAPDGLRAETGRCLPGRPDADVGERRTLRPLLHGRPARDGRDVGRLALRATAERREPDEPRARQHGRDRLHHARSPRRPLRRRHRVDRPVVRRLAGAEEVDADQHRAVARDRERLRARQPDERHEPVPGLRGRRRRRPAAARSDDGAFVSFQVEEPPAVRGAPRNPQSRGRRAGAFAPRAFRRLDHVRAVADYMATLPEYAVSGVDEAALTAYGIFRERAASTS